MKIGPSMPSTELRLIPRPLTTVGYNSDAIRGSTTNDDDMPILPTQYRARVTYVSENIKFTSYLPYFRLQAPYHVFFRGEGIRCFSFNPIQQVCPNS